MCQTETQAAATETTHPFETAGLGRAPFRLAGFSKNVYVAYQGAAPVPGGTCDYCATGIMYECVIESADKKRFVVGCDCVLRLDRDDRQLVDAVKTKKLAVEKAARAAKKVKTIAAERARIDAAFARLGNSDVRRTLASQPHPAITGDGHSLLTYVGHAGRLRAAKLIEGA